MRFCGDVQQMLLIWWDCRCTVSIWKICQESIWHLQQCDWS